MKHSTDRILTTHVGSLPRPDDLIDLLMAQDAGEGYDPALLARRVREGVADIVAKPVDAFVPAASPGVVVLFMPNKFYPSEDAYVAALAEALTEEYETIVKAGFVLQIDCPDLAMSRHLAYAGLSLAEFRRIAARNVEAINHATRNIPPEAMRMHLCWGNYAGPHTHDVPIKDVA